MANKMYYSEEEAAEKLGGAEKLKSLVTEQKLRVFHDGPRKMFSADEIDEFSTEVILEEPVDLAAGDTAEIQLVPSDDTAEQSAIDLADTDLGGIEVPSKEDTVITSEGMSIFDEEDLEIETASPMAKTGITPSMADQISLEGAGAGSGLLDLTRESDDTSLRAEVLDHIDMEGALDTSLQGEPAGATASYAPAVEDIGEHIEPQPVAMAATPVSVAVDPTVGLFSGLLVGCCLLALVLGAVTLGGLRGVVPGFVEILNDNLLIVLCAAVGVVVISAVVGLLLGKSAATRQFGEIRSEGQ